MYTLFQIMTLEGWAEIARSVQERFPAAFVFFISFILIASYTTLNIFIAIIVNTMSEIQARADSENVRSIGDMIEVEKGELKADIRALKDAVIRLEKKIG
jgi:voltage-gated sodium channel